MRAIAIQSFDVRLIHWQQIERQTSSLRSGLQAAGILAHALKADQGEPWAQPMRELAMASVETAADADLARAMGWRYFRVKTKAQPLLRQEMACPNETTGRQCIDCAACDGALKPSAANVVIIVHGPKAKQFERAHA